MKTKKLYKVVVIIMALFTISAMVAIPAYAAGQAGTTLAGYKTIDICDNQDGTWRYFGEIAVWNEGAIDTSDFTINDFIEYKTGGPDWTKACDVYVNYMPQEIPAGTTQETALTFPYNIECDPLVGDIRNNASLTILNHSGHLGTPWGPNPKATYDGEMPPPPCVGLIYGCTYTQGYWGNKPDVDWPDPYDRDAVFFLSGQTWQQVMDTSVNDSPGYYQLAHQYIAAVLNIANGASVPNGVQDTLDLAEDWLNVNNQGACTGQGSCGMQKDWAKILDDYNNGVYVGGPPHCGDEEE